ncbi:Carbohydrate sulfotransferase 1 [Chionoecetes opilio]|uniref:Carbohydrate sulfotransferase 1 n=1 Tax=Chionoecetes opilio TaxID=41210 RepID=A0A8J5C0B0_CHIOP|nr:Carbohydrate sulfotransferase 1 [Chionoecetes opilio]
MADINVIHPYTRNKTREHVRIESVKEYCKKEPLIIIKTIRMRLQWVRELMDRKEVDNMKVIHLVRDPRGSLTSMERLMWNTADMEACAKIHQDLQEKETMLSLYPSRYTFIKYEDLCRDPYGQTRRLLRFIRDQAGDGPNTENKTMINVKPPVGREEDRTRLDPAMYQDLPKGILDFLSNHLHPISHGKFGPFTTERNTASMYQRWRWIITAKQLESVQAACKPVIRALGHRLFRSFAAYTVAVSNRFDVLGALEDPLELWDTFKCETLQAAKESIGERLRSRRGFVSTEPLENIEKSRAARLAGNQD